MNSSTSCFCTSRKYSAIVSADSATRSRVPGGSSIWPNTSAVFSMTPDSVISRNRSLPSRVRSPTPANTETPPKFSATRRIISWMRTVLPTPAPPNMPILPPWTYGVSRSMTLMPVSNICGLGLELVERRRLPVDRPALRRPSATRRRLQRLAEGVEHVPLGHVAHRHLDRGAGVLSPAPRTRPSVGCMRDGAHGVVADVLRDLEGQRVRLARRRTSRPRAARCRSPASAPARTPRRRPGR